ncbi:hypothetical protein BC567DRAFT_2153 [Phyllosticta citribraziliensis]
MTRREGGCVREQSEQRDAGGLRARRCWWIVCRDGGEQSMMIVSRGGGRARATSVEAWSRAR